ncbi:hypothetical protein [Streptomyces sp. NPDC051219]|uniref:hypothetical protein n=1 Tax=Streptomyces sp. NPDC051219 TaxID=3155283 RepID=UPI00342D4A0F
MWQFWRVPVIVTGLAVPLYVLWAAELATGGGDLAAQLAWAGFTARHPGSAYNLSWYGGTHSANYSLLTPHLMAALGVRTVSVAAGLAGSWVMARILVRAGLRRPLCPALLASAALWCNVVSGRTTFALGVAIGLLALLYRRRLPVAVLCSALATMASPVAGLFLVVAGAAYVLDRQWRKGAALVVAPFVVVGTTTVLFPFQGEQPMAPGKLWMPLLACAALCMAAPRDWRVPRLGSAVYGVGVVLTFLIASPIGTNVERLVGLMGPPVLLAAVLAAGPREESCTGPSAGPRAGRWPQWHWRRGVLAGALVVSCFWLADKTMDDVRVATEIPAWAAQTEGVLAELRRLDAERGRVEVVPARNHREAAVLAPYVNMARGWNRQLDVERGRLFYDGSLTAETYRAWLDRWAVQYVVVHAGRPDGPAEGEAAVVAAAPDWLEPVWSDAGWRIYRVRDAVPLATAPASVVRGDSAELVIRVPRAGTVTVRVAYSPWLRAEGACVRQDGEWTSLTVRKAGDYRLGSEYAGYAADVLRSRGC